MSSIRKLIGMVAVCAIGACLFACKDRSHQAIIDSFIDEAPPIDLTNPLEVECAARDSEPRQVIRTAVDFWLFLGSFAEGDEDDCFQVIDRSDAQTGITDIEYRGDDCVLDEHGYAIDGRSRLTGDGTSRRIEYDNVRLDFLSDRCAGSTYSHRYSMLGTVSLPVGEVTRDVDAPGEYDVLIKFEFLMYTEECELKKEIQIHDYVIQVDVVDDGGQEQTIINQQGRSAIERREYPENNIRYDEPAVSLSATRENVVTESNVCAEPTSSRILLNAGDNAVVIEPNGAVDCDGHFCAPWTLDGEAQPEPVCNLRAPSCQAGSSGGMGVLMLVGLDLLTLRIRRRAHR